MQNYQNDMFDVMLTGGNDCSFSGRQFLNIFVSFRHSFDKGIKKMKTLKLGHFPCRNLILIKLQSLPLPGTVSWWFGKKEMYAWNAECVLAEIGKP